MSLRLDPFGPHAFLAHFGTKTEGETSVRGTTLLHHLEAHPPAGLLEVTPGFTSVLLEFDPRQRPDRASLARHLEAALVSPHSAPPVGRRVEIKVVYDGPDLERVAAHAGLSLQEVIRLHANPSYTVRLLGFAPGFPYLSGLDPRLQVPRLATPRPRIPAGSVAIGGEHTGIYPVATAGGWNLIGRTAAQLVDPEQAALGLVEAFLLRPGDTVRFLPVPMLQ